MSYDETPAVRVRQVLVANGNVVEKRMFGGLRFMVNGAMACGLTPGGLMLRVDPSATTTLSLSRTPVRRIPPADR